MKYLLVIVGLLFVLGNLAAVVERQPGSPLTGGAGRRAGYYSRYPKQEEQGETNIQAIPPKEVTGGL